MPCGLMMACPGECRVHPIDENAQRHIVQEPPRVIHAVDQHQCQAGGLHRGSIRPPSVPGNLYSSHPMEDAYGTTVVLLEQTSSLFYI